MTDYFTRTEMKTIPDEKKITTNNKPSPPRPRNHPKPAQSLKKKKNVEKQKKTVTQLRGFWTKFAEEQKQKKRREEEITQKTRNNENKKKETQENKLAPEITGQDVEYCKPTMNSYGHGQVHSNNPNNTNIPEHSKRPAKARIKLKSENNCSGDSPKNRIRKL